MKILEGDLIFIFVGSWISRLINLVQRGKFGQKSPSHIAIVSSVYANKVMLIEATLRGVKLTDMKVYDKATTWHKRIKNPKDIQKGLILLNEQIGIPYDYLQLVGILARSFFRLFGKKVYQKSKRIRNFLDSKQRFICAEIAYMFIKEATGKKPWDSHISQTTVWDIFRSPLLEDSEP